MSRRSTDTVQANAPAKWLSLPHAAELLDLTPEALRKTLERAAMKVTGGSIEANIDGVRARKFGRLWRVQLDARWVVLTNPPYQPGGVAAKRGVAS